MLEASFEQLELYMKMDASFKSGKLATLAKDASEWQSRANALADQYEANAAFAKAGWAHGSVYASYFKRFLDPAYTEADRIRREATLLSKQPACHARYRLAAGLELLGLEAPQELDRSDRSTDFCNETWSALGQHDYFGAMWYSLEVELDLVPSREHAYLWFSKVDGVARAWLNGVPLQAKNSGRDSPVTSETHLGGLTFDITGALRPKTVNRLTLVVQRTRLAELGAGGLLGPVYAYRESVASDAGKTPTRAP
jgi:hypothetical protein